MPKVRNLRNLSHRSAFDIDALIFENDETVGEFLDTSLVSAQGINDVMGIVRIEKICYDLQPYRSAPPRIG